MSAGTNVPPIRVAVAVGNDVVDGVTDAVMLRVSVCVAVALRVRLALRVAVLLLVMLAVRVCVAVLLRLGVTVVDAVRVAVRVNVGGGVRVAVRVTVAGRVAVATSGAAAYVWSGRPMACACTATGGMLAHRSITITLIRTTLSMSTHPSSLPHTCHVDATKPVRVQYHSATQYHVLSLAYCTVHIMDVVSIPHPT